MKYLLFILLALFNISATCQSYKTVKIATIDTTLSMLEYFPEIVFATIPGAPNLGRPFLIKSNSKAIISEGNGLASPAFYDFNGDGLKDLLIGEFGSGMEFGRYVGNFVRVFLNTGDDDSPQFEGNFDYARPSFQYQLQGNGTPFSVDQYCCMGFAPQFIDLNNDSLEDMITGQYQGEVSWFQNTKKGFLPGKPLLQEGNPRDTNFKKFVLNQFYWLYSTATFGDLTGDNLPDLITGGFSLRISKNIGTKASPKFSKREPLLDIHDVPLKVYSYSEEEYIEQKKWELKSMLPVPVSGDHELSPIIFDWDRDGILDLLATNSYTHKGLAVINFFKGVKTDQGYRFHPGVSLFESKNGKKAFPGSAPRIFIDDWNNDGINDLIIGISVVTIDNQFNQFLSWNWENETGIKSAGKDPATILSSIPASAVLEYKKSIKPPKNITIEQYITMRHRGVIYVMPGK